MEKQLIGHSPELLATAVEVLLLSLQEASVVLDHLAYLAIGALSELLALDLDAALDALVPSDDAQSEVGVQLVW